MASPRPYPPRASVVEPSYFSNWGDLWYPRLANLLLVPASRIAPLTPNGVTLGAFALSMTGAVLIVIGGGYAIAGALILPVAYTLDCLDGQLARYTGRTSALGDYLDKTLDVLKIGVFNLALSVAAYRMTGEALYLALGLVSCFGFLFRYYIKLETMFGAIQRDAGYLEKSRARRLELYAALDRERAELRGPRARLAWLWQRHRPALALDEAEHVTFAAVLVLAGRPDLWCWLFAIGQLTIAAVRLVGRARQVVDRPESLLDPLRK